MNFQTGVFFFFSIVLVSAAVAVVTVRNPVRAALSLVLVLFSAACLWILLEAEFLGIVLILVYVGAVMVLLLFVVMMLDINLVALREGFGEYLPLGASVAILLLIEMIVVLNAGDFSIEAVPAPVAAGVEHSNTRDLGRLLYTVYVYPFELAALILLVAIVAAISLTLRRRKDSRYQDPSRQVAVRKEDRVRLVDLRKEQARK